MDDGEWERKDRELKNYETGERGKSEGGKKNERERERNLDNQWKKEEKGGEVWFEQPNPPNPRRNFQKLNNPERNNVKVKKGRKKTPGRERELQIKNSHPPRSSPSRTSCPGPIGTPEKHPPYEWFNLTTKTLRLSVLKAESA